MLRITFIFFTCFIGLHIGQTFSNNVINAQLTDESKEDISSLEKYADQHFIESENYNLEILNANAQLAFEAYLKYLSLVNQMRKEKKTIRSYSKKQYDATHKAYKYLRITYDSLFTTFSVFIAKNKLTKDIVNQIWIKI